MSLSTITFWGETSNSYGVPDTLYSYLVSVFINEIFSNGDKIVKIVPLTANAPKPPQDRPFIVRNSTKEQAASEAFRMLREMPALQELHYSIAALQNKDEKLQFVSKF